MKRILSVLGFLNVVMLSVVMLAGAVQVYPGAKVEDTYQIKQPEGGSKVLKTTKVIVFTTNDIFERVVAFYQGIAREYRMPGQKGISTKLPSGQELKEAYFILDNASDIMTSKHWIKIQRPYLGMGQQASGVRSGAAVREVTGIIEEDKRSYP